MSSLCPNCFIPKSGDVLCVSCAQVGHENRPGLTLPLGNILSNRYQIGRILGSGGFGVTYLAHDRVLNARVAIKEYLPRQLAGRDREGRLVPYSSADRQAFVVGLQGFLMEARSVEKIRHENVVRVRDFFEGNGTAYMVMDFYDGRSLALLLEAGNGRTTESEARVIAIQVLAGLEAIHNQNYLHRDLKPANLYLVDRGRDQGSQVIILDFGAAREVLGMETQSLDLIFTDGYAPPEQYAGMGLGPWTDLYALAATLYRCVTGRAVPGALVRRGHDTLEPPMRLVSGLSPALDGAIWAGLRLDPNARPRSVAQFRNLLAQRELTEIMPVGVAVPKPDGSRARLDFTPDPPRQDVGAAAFPMPGRAMNSTTKSVLRSKALWVAVLGALLAGLPLAIFTPIGSHIGTWIMGVFQPRPRSVRCDLGTDPPVDTLAIGEQGYRLDVDLRTHIARTDSYTLGSLEEACRTLVQIHSRHPGLVESHRIERFEGSGPLHMSVIVYERESDASSGS
jgi:Protein kinase domain